MVHVGRKCALALALLFAVESIAGCEDKTDPRKRSSTQYDRDAKRITGRNAKISFRDVSQSQVDRQRDFMESVRKAFKPKHKCILVFCLTLMEEPLTKLVEASPLPVVIYHQTPDRACKGSRADGCGSLHAIIIAAADSTCRGILVMAGAYDDAVGGAVAVQLTPPRGPVTGLTSSHSVFLVTGTSPPNDGGPSRPGGNGIQELGRAEAVLFSWPSRQRWRLTDPYTYPRLWRPDRGLSEMTEAGKRDDFNGRILRVATFHQPPLVYIDNPADLKNVYGMEWAVLEMLAEHLNFTWSVLLTNSSERFGRPKGNSSWQGGALGALVTGEADLGLNVWVQLDQSRAVDFTSHTRISCLTFMVPRPHVLGSTADAVFQPLQGPVWAGWLLSILVATVASRLLDQAARQVGVATGRGYSSLEHSFYVLLGVAVVANVPPSRPSLGPQRHLLAWWVWFSVLMTTAFSSGLIAHLTMQLHGSPVNTVKDILEHGLTWASSYVPNFHVMLNLENVYERRLANGMELIDPPSWEPTVASGKYVVQGQKIDTFYFFWVGGGLGKETLSQMRLMKSCMVQYPVAIALQKDSALLVPFNRVISRIREAGLISYWQRFVVRLKGPTAIRSLFVDTINRNGPQVLKLWQLWSAFLVLLCGLLISTAAFILEMIVQPPEMHLKLG